MLINRARHDFLLFFLVVSVIFLTAYSVNGQDIPQQARRHMQRGITAVKMATSISDYEDAIKEFEAAKEIAPRWSDVYYNLALAQVKAGGHINVYKSAKNNLSAYLKFNISDDDRLKARDLLTTVDDKIKFIRNECTLAGIWRPVTDNDFSAEPRLEIKIGRDEKLYARALASKSMTGKDAKQMGSNAFMDGPFVPVKVTKKETEEPGPPEMTLKVPPTVYYEWKRGRYYSQTCRLKASFRLTRISEDTMIGLVSWSGRIPNPNSPVPFNNVSNFTFKKEKQ